MSAAATLSDNEPVLLESFDDGVLRLTLNRPAVRNALSVGLMSALGRALDRAAADTACRVVVIAGTGLRSAPATICTSCAPTPAERPTSVSLPSAAR